MPGARAVVSKPGAALHEGFPQLLWDVCRRIDRLGPRRPGFHLHRVRSQYGRDRRRALLYPARNQTAAALKATGMEASHRIGTYVGSLRSGPDPQPVGQETWFSGVPTPSPGRGTSTRLASTKSFPSSHGQIWAGPGRGCRSSLSAVSGAADPRRAAKPCSKPCRPPFGALTARESVPKLTVIL